MGCWAVMKQKIIMQLCQLAALVDRVANDDIEWIILAHIVGVPLRVIHLWIRCIRAVDGRVQR